MSILLLVVVLLVVAIVLSRLTWASEWGERRSIKHHEQAMDVLRSVAGRPESEGAEVGARAGGHGSRWVGDASTLDAGAGPPPPSPRTTIPEALSSREETIRILRSTDDAEPAPPWPAVARTETSEPTPAESTPSEPAASATLPPAPSEPTATPIGPDQGREPAPADRRAYVFVADDDVTAGALTDPRPLAEVAHQGDTGRWPDGGGGRDAGGDGVWTDDGGQGNGGQRDAAAGAPASLLPRPPSIGDQLPSRSQARSRARARTRSQLWMHLMSPVLAVARAGSAAFGRLRPSRPSAPAPSTSTETPETPPTGFDPARDRSAAGGGDATPAWAPQSPGDSGRAAALAEVLASNGERAERAPSGARTRRRPPLGVAIALVAVVVVACIVAVVLVATGSSSNNHSQQVRQAAPPPARVPATLAPAPAVKLVSSDNQGAVYNTTSSHVVVSAAATGRVWLQFVSGTGPFGPTLWQGILTGGQSQTITVDGPLWMRIGAASNVVVTANGTRVLTPIAPVTYNLTFSHS